MRAEKKCFRKSQVKNDYVVYNYFLSYQLFDSINQSINLFAHKQHKMTIKHRCKSKTYKAQ